MPRDPVSSRHDPHQNIEKSTISAPRQRLRGPVESERKSKKVWRHNGESRSTRRFSSTLSPRGKSTHDKGFHRPPEPLATKESRLTAGEKAIWSTAKTQKRPVKTIPDLSENHEHTTNPGRPERLRCDNEPHPRTLSLSEGKKRTSLLHTLPGLLRKRRD